jgi:F-type H+-transporting ATPase subunit gamma
VANLKAIRKRISSVKSTQKITRAMKMVAGARLNRAQHRITAMRPFAVDVSKVLSEVVRGSSEADVQHPLLARREEKRALVLVVSSDRGLCGAFNTNVNKAAEAFWREKQSQGVEVQFATVGRRARDYLRRRKAPVLVDFDGVWDDLNIEQAKRIARTLLAPFLRREFDSIYLVYNEFKSAMTQNLTRSLLLPLSTTGELAGSEGAHPDEAHRDDAQGAAEYIFEPDRASLFERLVPMYIEITILRALYESMASELGARMTAMDAATKNAKDMIGRLTLQYNRQRQAVITTELIEIVSGANALQA